MLAVERVELVASEGMIFAGLECKNTDLDTRTQSSSMPMTTVENFSLAINISTTVFSSRDYPDVAISF